MTWTLDATRALYGKESEKSFSVLLSIEHPQIEGGVLRVGLNDPGQDIWSNLTNADGPQLGQREKFTAYPFDIELAQDVENAPTLRIAIANVDPKIGQTFRSIRESATVYVAVILLEDPDNILTEYFAFKLRHVSINALTLDGELLQANVSSEPYPFLRVTQLRFPGLFN